MSFSVAKLAGMYVSKSYLPKTVVNVRGTMYD